jgi:hypothetical protein
VTTPAVDEQTHFVRLPSRRRPWVLVLLLVLAVAAVGVWLAWPGITPRSAAQLEPRARPYVAPLPAPTFHTPRSATDSAPAANDSKPAKKGVRKKAAPATGAPTVEKKWDPDALFPQ